MTKSNQTLVGAGKAAANQSRGSEAMVFSNPEFGTVRIDSDEKLQVLLGEIARSIDLGEYNAIYGDNEHGRINPTAKNEWYYIFEALQEAGVCRKSVGTRSLWRR